MRGVTILREARESCEGSFAPRFDKCEVTNQGDAFEPSLPVTVRVEGPAIEFALQPVIVYEPGEEYRVNRARGEESKNLGRVLSAERLDRQRVGGV